MRRFRFDGVDLVLNEAGKWVKHDEAVAVLRELEAKIDRLLELVSDAHGIICDSSPGNTAWLDAAEAAMESK